MSYEKHTWSSREVISSKKLNNIENGIEAILEIAQNNASNVSDMLEQATILEENMNGLRTQFEAGDFDGVVLSIDSSNGIAIKDDSQQNILSVTVFTGNQQITDITKLRQKFGNTAYLQWYSLQNGDDTYTRIAQNDPRISKNGFKFSAASSDIDLKCTFKCELIV